MARIENNRIVVSNTSPIINLCKVGLARLIKEMYSHVVVPKAVFEELMAGRAPVSEMAAIEELFAHKVLQVHSVKDRSLVRLIEQQLDHGEAEAIALAIELNAGLIFLDEVDARRVAQVYKINKTGFIGILIAAEKENKIVSALEMVKTARSKGFWINDDLFKEICLKLK